MENLGGIKGHKLTVYVENKHSKILLREIDSKSPFPLVPWKRNKITLKKRGKN